MRIKLYNPKKYFQSKNKLSLLTGSMLFISGIMAILPSILRLYDMTSYSLAITNFDKIISDIAVALLLLLPSVILFSIAYLLWERHSFGNKASLAAGLGTIALLAIESNSLTFLEFSALLVITAFSFSAGALELLGQRRGPKRKLDSPLITEKLAKFGLKISGIVCITVLVGMIVYIIVRASPYLTIDFLTGTTWSWAQAAKSINGLSTTPMGGIVPYAVGSLLIVGVCELIAIPLGLGAAVYLSEYASQNKVTSTIRFFVETLAGVPSVVIALLGWSLFYFVFRWGASLLGGAIALTFMILPFNIRIAEEAIRTVPASYREASFALGATKWQTIRRTVLFPASPGIITGFLLGVGAAIGETIVVVMTAGAPPPTATLGFLSTQNIFIGTPIPTLSGFIWQAPSNLALSGGVGDIVFQMYGVSLAGAFVLIAIYLVICSIGLIIRNYLTKKIRGK